MQYFSSLRFRPGLTPTLATLVAVAILSSLGFWQVRRLHWKQGLVAQWNARIALPPLSLGEALAADPPGREYRRVTLRGVFDTAQTVVIAHMPRGLYEGGEILTPLRPSGGGAPVLVDRGWVPDRKVEAFLQSDHGGDEVEVTGRILELDLGAARPGARKERRRIWVHFDTVRQARVLQEQLPYRLAPFLVQRGDDGSQALPLGGYEAARSRVDHRSYAITWFGMAAVAVGVWIGMGVQRGRVRASPPHRA
jgi:surfeit locus 1 family protein